MTMRLIILICVWLVSIPVGYVIIRRDTRASGGSWTRNDRLATIMLSLLSGPLILLMSPVIFLITKLAKSKWGNSEASW